MINIVDNKTYIIIRMAYIIGLNTNVLPRGYDPILNYYNEKREEGSEELQLLNRAEGGFMIEIPENKNEEDSNNRIRQLRWSNFCLVSDIYIGFNDKQLDLLYEALVDYLGEDMVYKTEKKINNNSINRTTQVKILNGKHYVRAMY